MDYRHTTDLELWDNIRQDDTKAYAELFDRYFPKAYTLASQNLKSNETAEELAMDVFFNLWQKRKEITINGKFSNYLFRSTKNAVINHLQKKPIIYVPVESLHNEETLTGTEADQALHYKETEQIYKTALTKISPQRQKIFRLSREENLTYSEIAKETGLSVNTVKNYITAALTDLREQMNDYPTVIWLVGFCSYAFIIG